MSKKLNEFTPQQYKKYNGQSIMLAFKSMDNKATLDDLSKYIARSIEKPEENIRNEIINVLNRGIDDGFLLKRGQYYLLAGKDDYQVDFTLRGESKSQLMLPTQAEEIAELKERQKLRNQLELSIYKMSTEELRKIHSIYVNDCQNVQKDN